jgi:hypothetical protein
VQLVELQQHHKALQTRGVGLAAITIDTPEVLATFHRERGLTYPLLAGRELVLSAGLIDRRFDGDDRRRGAPHPVTYLLAATGRITRRFFENERFSTNAIVLRASALEPQHQLDAETAHLTLTTWISDAQVAENRRFSLITDVTPNRGMHIYAAGNANYQAVSIEIRPQPGLTAYGTELPPSEEYHYRPTNERVQVYQKPFRIITDASFVRGDVSTAISRPLRIEGQLLYQACDDLVCYPRARVPVTWNLIVQP